MKPNYLAALLMLILPITWTASALADDVPFTYTTNSAAITITGYTGSGGNVVIPDTIDGYPVTTIGYCAFIACSSLTNVVIPDSVTGIYEGAFWECTSLTEVVIPDSVTTIGDNAFFACSGLSEVVIPDSVTTIGEKAFLVCEGLTNIIVAAANPNYISLDGVLFDKELISLIQFPEGFVGSYAIPGSVTTIDDWAFSECTSLMEVVIPDSVTNIGGAAFKECTGLTNVVIGSGVTTIGGSAFFGCSGLTNMVIGSGVTTISGSAFRGCTGLKKVVIPDSVTRISYGAFFDCINLQQVYFLGNAPIVEGVIGRVFSRGTDVTVYYLDGTTGWGDTFGGWPTALYPPAQP